MQRDIGLNPEITPPDVRALKRRDAGRAGRRAGRVRADAGRRPSRAEPAAAEPCNADGTAPLRADRHGGVLPRPAGLRVHHRRRRAPTCSSTRPTAATPIATGQRVEFAVREGRRGLEAYDVVAV